MNTHAASLAAFLACSLALAGPLDPPPGVPGPSGPTLVEVHDNDRLADTVDDIDQLAGALALFEPRTDVLSLPGDASNAYIIDAPGSYYLSDDILIDAANVNAIRIAADNVTLDLGGNLVINTATNNGAYGVMTDIDALTRTNVVVRNGSVAGFQNGQVRLDVTAGRVENVVAVGGEQSAIALFDGGSNMIIGCRVYDMDGGSSGFATLSTAFGSVVAESHARLAPIGFSVGRGAALRDCTATGSTGAYGYFVRNGSVVRRCAARDGASHGFYALFQVATLFADCSSVNNQAAGFSLEQSLATNCLAQNSGTDGFFTRFRSYIESCTAIDSDDAGFEIVFPGNRVEGCHAESVATIPATNGFIATQSADGCMVVRNTAVNAFGHFVNAAVSTSLFAPHWFDITLAGPWDNLAQ